MSEIFQFFKEHYFLFLFAIISFFLILSFSKFYKIKFFYLFFGYLGLIIFISLIVFLKNEKLFEIGKAPSFSLTNQYGKTISNEDLKGKVHVVEFFFSTCPTICPIMNQNMLKIEKEFLNHDDFAIVSITINPDYDTSEVLKKHAEHLGVQHKNWHFLTGKKDYIYQISNKGFNLYAAENNKAKGGFEHSGFFALIDKNGNIRCREDELYSSDDFSNPILYYDGLEEAGITAIIEDIKLLLKE
jgi:protein SCO1/2